MSKKVNLWSTRDLQSYLARLENETDPLSILAKAGIQFELDRRTRVIHPPHGQPYALHTA